MTTIILTPAGCSKQTTSLTQDKFLLDTLVTIKLYGPVNKTEADLKKITDKTFKRIALTEKRLNAHDSPSETAKINKTAGRPYPYRMSSDMLASLVTAEQVNKLTGGAFDVSIGPLMSKWRFEQNNPRIPKSDDIKKLLKNVNSKLISFDYKKKTVMLAKDGVGVDLGGIAKGTALDAAAELLKKKNIKCALITCVSGTKVIGPKPDGRPWRIGIQSPRPNKKSSLIGIVELKRGSISTSGDYQQYFIKDGRRYHHIIDPKTGYPAPGFMSVTVVTSKSAAFADALSTGLAVMGRTKAMELVEKLPGVDCIFVDGQGKVWISSGLKGKVKNLIRSVN